MKKLYSIFSALIIFSIVFLSTSPSFARGPMNKHRHNGDFHVVNSNKCKTMDYDYDLIYVNKILKQDKKTLKISKDYLNKIKTNGVKQFAQAVIDKKEKQVKQMEDFIKEYEESLHK